MDEHDAALDDAAAVEATLLLDVLTPIVKMPQSVLKSAMERLGCDWCQVYGMTEGAPINTFMTHEDHRRGVSGSDPEAAARLRPAGRPVVGVDLEIRTEAGGGCEIGRVGEIVVRGPNIMKGYLNRPEETAAALVGDGWYRTGDMGYMDDGGYLYVVDRLEDMIISGGENVYSTEVENALDGALPKSGAGKILERNLRERFVPADV